MKNLILTALLCTLSVPAFAGYTGPQDLPKVFTTAREALEYPIEDHEVKLQGHVVKRIGHDKYLFRDKTSAIRLEIDGDVMPKEDFDDKAEVIVFGEVDATILDNPQIDVDRIEIVK